MSSKCFPVSAKTRRSANCNTSVIIRQLRWGKGFRHYNSLRHGIARYFTILLEIFLNQNQDEIGHFSMARTDFIFNIGKELNYLNRISAIMLMQNNVQDLIANLANTVSTDEIKQTKLRLKFAVCTPKTVKIMSLNWL